MRRESSRQTILFFAGKSGTLCANHNQVRIRAQYILMDAVICMITILEKMARVTRLKISPLNQQYQCIK